MTGEGGKGGASMRAQGVGKLSARALAEQRESEVVDEVVKWWLGACGLWQAYDEETGNRRDWQPGDWYYPENMDVEDLGDVLRELIEALVSDKPEVVEAVAKGEDLSGEAFERWEKLLEETEERVYSMAKVRMGARLMVEGMRDLSGLGIRPPEISLEIYAGEKSRMKE